MSKRKLRVVLVVPTPPPFAGPEVFADVILKSGLRDRFDLIHLCSTINRNNEAKGRVSLFNILKVCKQLIDFIYISLLHRPVILYTFVSQNTTGFIRDSAFIILGAIFQQKIVLHFHGGNFGNFYEKTNAITKVYIRLVLKFVDILLVLAHTLECSFKNLIERSRIRILYNCVNAKEFGSLKYPATRKNEPLNVLYVGHLSVAKGFFDLLKSIPRIIDVVPESRFLFAGEYFGKERNILYDESGRQIDFFESASPVKMAKDLGIESFVSFLGIVYGRDKLDLFNHADLFVLPSYSEGFPISILEAMSAGLPIVTTPVGAIPEIFVDQKNGILVPPGNSDMLSQEIINLLIDYRKRSRISAFNQQYVTKHFDVSIISEKLGDFFEETLKFTQLYSEY